MTNNLSEAARKALIDVDRHGAIPQGTTTAVRDELRAAGLVRAIALTAKGRLVRHRLLDAALEEL